MIKLYGGNEYLNVKFWSFPAGERGVKICDVNKIEQYKSFTIKLIYESSEDLIDLLLLVNAMRNVYCGIKLRLVIPYFPYARQDRVCSEGESFSLQVAANLINMCNFWEVVVDDPHSNVLSAFFAPGVLTSRKQSELLYNEIGYLRGKQGVVMLAPDNGAVKKTYEIASKLNFPVIEANKRRCVETGNIIGVSINYDFTKDNSIKEVIICDDICDGGRTFVEIAKEIRKTFNGKLTLAVVHGIFSKGFSELEIYFDTIIYVNNLVKGLK